jgi:phage anti-repressor protein
MRDILSKLDALLNETASNPNDVQGDYDVDRDELENNPHLYTTVKEYKKDTDNFTADDIKELEGIKDLATLKERAFALISTPSKKPMKPEKVAWFKGAIERMTNHNAVIKLMWDLLLSGEGQAVIGSRSSMNPNNYRSRFNEEGVVESTFEIGDAFDISFTEDSVIESTIVDILADGIVIELDDAALEMLTNEGLTFLEGEIVTEEKQKGVDGKACWKGYKRMGTKQKGGKTVDNCVKMEDHGPEDPDAVYNRGEYDREGDMAKDQLRVINDAAKELYAMLDVDENLPEWVQKKITLAMDYIDTARDYMKANKYAESTDVSEAEYQGRKVPLGKPMAGDVKKSKVYVKNPQGRVVKVNFGDKKMKIKKSNPARRKSFRARHNCANPGPRHKARYWSCRAW